VQIRVESVTIVATMTTWRPVIISILYLHELCSTGHIIIIHLNDTILFNTLLLPIIFHLLFPFPTANKVNIITIYVVSRWCLFPFFLYIVFTRLPKETQNKILRDIFPHENPVSGRPESLHRCKSNILL